MPPAANSPLAHPPPLPSPNRLRPHSHWHSSRSPARQHARDYDPLLRDLSPTTTLRAFVTPPHNSQSINPDPLATSIQNSSAGERALGAKAARACLDLRAWALEMEGWQWPGTFDFPEPARKKLRLSASTSDDPTRDGGEEDYWGSLPARRVKAYEKRADEISQGLDEMDVEELKEFVLNSHYRTGSRPASRNNRLSVDSTSSGTANLKRLDDYTALVTATILQALPFLTRLGQLLDIWTIRLIILRNASRYIQDLQRARLSLDQGWAAIQTTSQVAAFDKKTMSSLKSAIEQQVASLGRRLDRFLDDLEGTNDRVPDTWIEEFEVLEAAYSSWVVQAEQKVLENEWSDANFVFEQRPMTATAPLSDTMVSNDDSLISEVEDPELDEGAVMRPSMDDRRDILSTQSPSSGGSQLRPSTPAMLGSDLRGDDVSATYSTRSEGSTRTPPSLSREKQIGQIWQPSSAFLHNVEASDALKQSQSPARPFEHASTAFTKLFKKHQKSDQVRPERALSKERTTSTGDNGSSPVGRHSLRSSSATSPKRSPIERKQSAGTSDNSRGEVADVGSGSILNATPSTESQRVAPEPALSSKDGELSFGSSQFNDFRKPPPETYIPSGLNSPFSSPSKQDLAEEDEQNGTDSREQSFDSHIWPLSQARTHFEPSQGGGREDHARMQATRAERDTHSELYNPPVPMQTDAFDQFFVQNMPEISSDGLDLRDIPEVVPRRVEELQGSPSPSRGDRGSAMYLDMALGRSRRTSSGGPHSLRTRVPPEGSQRVPGVDREDHAGGSALAHLDGNHDYRSAGTTAIATEHSEYQTAHSSPHSPASVDESNVEDVRFGDEMHIARPNSMKRASMTSIEIFSRAEVKSIDIQRLSRNGSVSSRPTPPHTPTLPPDLDPLGKARPSNHKGLIASQSTHSRKVSSNGLEGTVVSTALPEVAESSPTAADTTGSPSIELAAAPLNAAMTKRGAMKTPQHENQRPGSRNDASPAAYVDPQDSFDRHVSEVLERLPAQIRFTSRPGAETPTAQSRGYTAPRTKMSNMRAPSRTSNMTIAPAEVSPKKSSSASDPEVKLYHLIQAGRDEPIKLFVRLVGEGERVMVRVGGGWADLADYLRQYADHHGSRTVSDGVLEVQTFSAPSSRKVSGVAEARAKTPRPGTPSQGTPLRPSSNDSDKDFYGRASTPNGELNGRQTPNSVHAFTPKSTSTSSRPSTAQASRPSSRQGDAVGVGLGGPSSGKKGALPEHKAKWVDSMLERAKKASAEKPKEDNQKYFSELGKAGGTRRVIFRSSPGVSTGEKGNNK